MALTQLPSVVDTRPITHPSWAQPGSPFCLDLGNPQLLPMHQPALVPIEYLRLQTIDPRPQLWNLHGQSSQLPRAFYTAKLHAELAVGTHSAK